MKNRILLSLLAGVFVLAFPIINATADPDGKEDITESAAPMYYMEQEKNEMQDTQIEETKNTDETVTVRVLTDGSVTELTMAEYLKGVLAAEMPVSFDIEALKAQTVAARTYTMYKMQVSPSPNHPEADVCGDPSCCKAYISADELREKWVDDFESNYEKILRAVNETDGIYLVYNDEPILAAFHSSSCGQTASSAEVWGGELPYLVSVESPECEDEVPGYISSVTVSFDDFRETFLSYHPDADLSGVPEAWISEALLSDSGRIERVSVGGVTVNGTEIRSMFSLRSTAMDISVGDDIVITTTGYGHGVGMSQYGANIMARQGNTFDEILLHYYPGTEIKNS